MKLNVKTNYKSIADNISGKNSLDKIFTTQQKEIIINALNNGITQGDIMILVEDATELKTKDCINSPGEFIDKMLERHANEIENKIGDRK